ncbi:hypothetical protein BHM03_00015771 [Ensete ventricosum]|nr:hypothetical protein BHM03_00015771 [Ensete ventricosum]
MGCTRRRRLMAALPPLACFRGRLRFGTHPFYPTSTLVLSPTVHPHLTQLRDPLGHADSSSAKLAFIVGAVDRSYLITLLRLWLTMPSYPPTMLVVLAMRRAIAGGGADLICVRSAIRPLAPLVYPAGYLRQVGHVGGPTVRGCDDLAARSAFVISFFPSREDLLEAPDEGAEDEVLCLTAGSRSS